MALVHENPPASAPLSSDGSLVGMRTQADFTAGLEVRVGVGWEQSCERKNCHLVLALCLSVTMTTAWCSKYLVPIYR